METEYRIMSVEYPYHLCPVCGLSSGETSRVCSKHGNYTLILSYWTDGMGRPILDDVGEVINKGGEGWKLKIQ